MTTTPDGSPDSSRPPAPLTVAVSLVVVEALVFVILAVAELAALDGQRAVMGATTAVFFLVYGAGLGVCALAVWRLRSWGRAPIVLAQLIQLLVAWNFWGGATTWVALGLALVAVIVVAGVLHPLSIDALAERG